MAISNGPNLGVMVNGAQGEAHYSEFMKFLRAVDGWVMPSVKDIVLTPPGGPTDGDRYLIGVGATGSWTGLDNKLARWSSVANAWEVYTPKEGWQVHVNDEDCVYIYDGAAWVKLVDQGVRLDNSTSTTVGAAGAATALPAQPTGYLQVSIGGVAYKIPYYAVS